MLQLQRELYIAPLLPVRLSFVLFFHVFLASQIISRTAAWILQQANENPIGFSEAAFRVWLHLKDGVVLD